MSSLFSMDWTCCRCYYLNSTCTRCTCDHTYCRECAGDFGIPRSDGNYYAESSASSATSSPTLQHTSFIRRPSSCDELQLPPKELVAPFASPRGSVSMTRLTTTITSNNPIIPPTRRRFFPSISAVQDLGSKRRRSKSPQHHRKTPSNTPSLEDECLGSKRMRVSKIDKWWIDL